MNVVAVIGRLVESPELRYTTNGNGVASFTLAVNDGYGEKQRTYFVDCVAWRKTGELIAEHFKKGDQLPVMGKLTTRIYEDKEGKKRKVTELLVESFDFVGGKKSDSSQEPKGDDPFANESKTVNISDDDLPF